VSFNKIGKKIANANIKNNFQNKIKSKKIPLKFCKKEVFIFAVKRKQTSILKSSIKLNSSNYFRKRHFVFLREILSFLVLKAFCKEFIF